MKDIELLAPAGSLEKLKYAIHYGADAVYCGLPDFSMRRRINSFDEKSLQEAVEFVHQKKKKIYVTINIYAHNVHIAEIEKHLQFLKKLKIDGVVVSDPGILNLIKKYLPKTEIHLSTQANVTNWQAAKFWHDLGIKRIVLARETSLEEIREIKKRIPKLELEYFVHGAMCMSYSGRCILSKWMNGRSANLGDCTQPCRWKYHSVVDDQKRFHMDLEEDQHGTYFFNSYDMNLLEYLDELVRAGVTSFKIEGRNKSIYYVSIVTKAYRKVLDSLLRSRIPKSGFKKAIRDGQKELNKLIHRGYSTGFLLGQEPPHNFANDNIENSVKFVGEIEGAKTIKGKKMNIVRVHNEIFLRDKLELVGPKSVFKMKIKKIFNHKMEKVTEAHGGHEKRYFFEFNKVLAAKTLLRVEIKANKRYDKAIKR